MKSENIVIGRVSTSHGIKGELLVLPLTDDVERFLDLDYFFIEGVRYDITRARLHKGQVILASSKIPDRNASDKLRGKYIEISRQDALPLGEDEYYIEDLKGLKVYDTSSDRQGILVDVIRAGGADVFVISIDGKEVMMPFLLADVPVVDVFGGFIRADLSKAV